MGEWTCALELDRDRSAVSGAPVELRRAIRDGADLRINTEFRHNEHIDPGSDSPEVVREAAELRVTYLVDDRWVAGIMTLRQPVDLTAGFGPRPSMSFYMYNEDARKGVARPHLDGPPATGAPGPSPSVPDHADMPKYHQFDGWDTETNAPSHNFTYDFDLYRYWVRDDWREVLAHADDGRVGAGSVDALVEAFSNGAEVKVGIRNLCSGLASDPSDALDHEVFIQLNSCYYYTEQKLFIGSTHPLVRVRPAVPMEYVSKGWDFGWAVVGTDGQGALRLVDPYTLGFHDDDGRYAVRWFVRG